MSDNSYDNLSMGASSIDAFLGEAARYAPTAREHYDVPSFGEYSGIQAFLDAPTESLPPIDFTDMGMSVSAMINPLMDLPDKVRVASIDQLFASGFLSMAGGDTSHLIHRSNRDLWRLSQSESGYVIERLFDDEGNPLKG